MQGAAVGGAHLWVHVDYGPKEIVRPAACILNPEVAGPVSAPSQWQADKVAGNVREGSGIVID